MHHVENNLDKWDLSSTEPYQRDNLLHFFYYYLRFLFAIWFELPYYALKRNRTRCLVIVIPTHQAVPPAACLADAAHSPQS